MKKHLFKSILILSLFISSCRADAAPTEESPPTDIPQPTEIVEEVPTPTPLPEPTSVPTTPPEPEFIPQPPDGQRMEFKTADDTNLVGYYYPAAVPNAPIIVLMHWARGDQTDWQKNGLIDWLQNRGGGGGTQSPARQSVIYPPMPKGISFAVFTFDFRGFGESKGKFTKKAGLIDAQSAYEFAKTLDGIDPTRMAGIGSSIGADGVVNGCVEGCLGALSLSPGDYLSVSYAKDLQRLEDTNESRTIMCVASKEDRHSTDTCSGTAKEIYTNLLYTTTIFDGDNHGDMFFYQEPENGFGQIIYNWLESVFEW